MVLPRFVRQALKGENLTVYGDGKQSRCFAHVDDVVRALFMLLENDLAVGEAFNVGSTSQIDILDLAQLVIERSGSGSGIRFVPFDVAYEPGFEEVDHRQPNTAALTGVTGWLPERSIEDAIDDVVEYERSRIPTHGRLAVA
jgi:UDP-glucose 4-epimerase